MNLIEILVIVSLLSISNLFAEVLDGAPSWFPKPPSLSAPTGIVFRASSVQEVLLQAEKLEPGSTLLLKPGVYKLPRTMVLRSRTNVVIRSESGDPRSVTLQGLGWDEQSRGDILHIGDCDGVTIAGLSFEEARSYGIKVEAEKGPANIHVYNCRFKNLGVRAIKGSAGTDPRIKARHGSVKFCLFENTRIPPADWLFGGNYISAIDMMALQDWTFSYNIFRNIKGRSGGARAAIFIWVRSTNIVVENNIILNCDRGIAFGNPGQSTANQAGKELIYVEGGVIRNNFISGGDDCAIELWHSRNIKIFHNSIWRPEKNWGRGIRIGKGTAATEIVNNLVHGEIRKEGGAAVITNNLSGDIGHFFIHPITGNLVLSKQGNAAKARGRLIPEVLKDIGGRARSSAPFLGAWEGGQLPLGVD